MISQTTEYALRAVVYLASSGGTPINRNAIAEATGVPTDYLTKVLQELDQAAIVSAQRGPGGGYQLNVDPNNTSVYDVVEAISGVPRITVCPIVAEGHAKLCPLHRRLDEAAALVEEAFRNTSISELIPNRRCRSACTFPIED